MQAQGGLSIKREPGVDATSGQRTVDSNILRKTYTLKAADPYAECDQGVKINHILKFHPGDKDALDQYGHEWLLKRSAPPKREEEPEQQQPRRRKRAPRRLGPDPDQVRLTLVLLMSVSSSTLLGDISRIFEQSWQQPLLLTCQDDTRFLRAFTARREKFEVCLSKGGGQPTGLSSY